MLTVTDKLRYNIYLLVFFTSVYLMLDMKKTLRRQQIVYLLLVRVHHHTHNNWFR